MGAAKAGVDALTKVLATEWGPYGIRVVGIVPGYTKGTEGFARLGSFSNANDKAATASASQSPDKIAEAMTAAIPMPLMRFAEVEDIANAAMFLGSAAGGYMTGTTITVDGGCWLTVPNLLFYDKNFVDQWRSAKL